MENRRELWSGIYSDILKKILNGQLKKEMLIPSESSLVEEYKVSRATVRRALEQLEQTGLLEIVDGVGRKVSARENLSDYAEREKDEILFLGLNNEYSEVLFSVLNDELGKLGFKTHLIMIHYSNYDEEVQRAIRQFKDCAGIVLQASIRMDSDKFENLKLFVGDTPFLLLHYPFYTKFPSVTIDYSTAIKKLFSESENAGYEGLVYCYNRYLDQEESVYGLRRKLFTDLSRNYANLFTSLVPCDPDLKDAELDETLINAIKTQPRNKSAETRRVLILGESVKFSYKMLNLLEKCKGLSRLSIHFASFGYEQEVLDKYERIFLRRHQWLINENWGRIASLVAEKIYFAVRQKFTFSHMVNVESDLIEFPGKKK